MKTTPSMNECIMNNCHYFSQWFHALHKTKRNVIKIELASITEVQELFQIHNTEKTCTT